MRSARTGVHYEDALGAACGHGHLSIVKLLSEPSYGLTFSTENYEVSVVAARSGHPQILAFLLQRADFVLKENSLGSRILHSAARAGCTAIIALMIDAGIDVNGVEYLRGRCALQSAAQYGHEETVRYLLESGADPNYYGHYSSALGAAANRGHTTILKTLLEYAAPINEARPAIAKALIQAAKESQIEVLQYFLHHGADLSVEDCGAKALEDAAFEGQNEVVRMLVGAGVNVDGKGRTSKPQFGSPLLSAHIGGQTSTVKLITGLGVMEVNPLSTEYRDDFLEGYYPYELQLAGLLRQ